MAVNSGHVIGVNGNMVNVAFDDKVIKNEVGYIIVGNERLKGEVIRVNDGVASLQVYEMTNGIAVGDKIEFTGDLLSVELGPGLLTQVFDGLQNPLPELAEKCGFFLQRGVYLDPIPNKEWDFTPSVKVGDKVLAGSVIGTVPEGIFSHKIMVPFLLLGTWTVVSIKAKGKYHAKDTIAVIKNEKGEEKELSMIIKQPVKMPIKCYEERLRPSAPMVTQIRLIDTFLPVAKGGTYCIPGPFGAGKTVLQHLTSKNADVDIVIIAACGERAGEVVEILKEYPELIDPKTGKSLMERTIVICNTSSMPVAAREASVYTAVTMAEYYRNMGLDVLLLADSTSRWAQAMREMSGRLEEIPGDEAFPAYLESRIAEFYERAGKVRLRDGSVGTVTIGGTVSPAIDPLDSWSNYHGIIEKSRVDYVYGFVRRGNEIAQMMKVVGEEGTSLEDYVIYQKGDFVDYVYLQQNSFDPVDATVSVSRQQEVFGTLESILKSDFALSDKREARLFFNQLRQLFLDWNGKSEESEEYKSGKKAVTDFFSSKVVK